MSKIKKSQDVTVTVQQAKPLVKAIVQPMSVGFQPKPGEYHLVKLDKNGAEVIGSDVSVSTRTYERSFKHRNDYKVKKNPQ